MTLIKGRFSAKKEKSRRGLPMGWGTVWMMGMLAGRALPCANTTARYHLCKSMRIVNVNEAERQAAAPKPK
jgi:hypothetical protein